eukprot:TRINITY_DN1466_c0_g1_i2.p1 TRINITY_DN1466_c0_g1~~TRINITY_DN1466_c0_g1_i2.p1  ORF type:complete len:1055 (+),score=171.10 TRINITY_DN1466_c0_g1_i2:911-4075(+)
MYSLAESDAVVDDYDYTERQDPPNDPSNLINKDSNTEAPNRSNSSFDIAPLWQRLKHVDELDDIDHSRRLVPSSSMDLEEDDEVRPVPHPSAHLKQNRESKPSSISHSRRNRPLPKQSRAFSATAPAKSNTSRQSSKRSIPSVEMTSGTSAPAIEDSSKQSLPTLELKSVSEVRATKPSEAQIKPADKLTPVPFPRSASASKPPLPRSRSSACDSEPSFAALQTVNHKSASLPPSSNRPGTAVQIQGSDRDQGSPERKLVPTASNEDPLATKRPPLPNRKTSRLAEEKKTFIQAIAHAENAMQISNNEITGTTILPIPQTMAKNRDTFEKGSQTNSTVPRPAKIDEGNPDVDMKPDSYGALSSPLTPDSKTEKSFSFKSLPSVSKETFGESAPSHYNSAARESLSSQISKALDRRDASETPSSQAHEIKLGNSLGNSKKAFFIPRRSNNSNEDNERAMPQDHGIKGYRGHGSDMQHSSTTLADLTDIKTTHVEEREVQHVDGHIVGNQEIVLPDASLASSSENDHNVPFAGNVVPTVVDPNAAEPVALSSKSFRRHSNRINASLRYTYAEDESFTFSALNEEDQLVNEPRSKLSIPPVTAATASSMNDDQVEGVDIFEAANRAAVDINALVNQSKENESAVGSLDGLDLEPVVLPGDDDYSVAPMSPVQNYTPVAGIYYGNSSPSEEALSPDDSLSENIGIAEYPEYELLMVGENENEDSVFGSEPNTPVPKESSGWRGARPKRSRDLSEQVRDSVAVQLASLSTIHGGRGAGDRNTGKMVPEVLLRDWSGNTPIEPTVEVVDSAPNSRSSESHVFRAGRLPIDVERAPAINVPSKENPLILEVRDRLHASKDRLFRVSSRTRDTQRAPQMSSVENPAPGQFSTSSFPRRRTGEVIPHHEGLTVEKQDQRNGRLSHSMALGHSGHFSSNGRSRTFEPALPKAFAMDPVLQDFQVPVTRKSLSEAGGRRRGFDQNAVFLDEESYAGNIRNGRKEDLSFKPSNHDGRPIHLPSNRRLASDIEPSAGATRDEGQAFRNVVGRLVNRMQSAKRLLSTS